ncbi:MAG: RDD family protein [Chloroflexi bacterium]|nr:RDD family protein [Chloroflexota bacterium]
MDDSYGLSTPEQVELGYEVAGLGSRFVAALIDVLIQMVVMLALFLAALLGGVLTLAAVGRRVSGGAQSEAVFLLLAVMVLVLFVVIWGYYIFFEMVWNGQTPGKRRLGIRVLTTGGEPITLTHSLVRNLVRLIDFLPSSYMLGAAVMLLNGRAQRLGDLAAGTIVVKERRERVPSMLAALPSEQALAPQDAAAFTAEDVALAREFLVRQDELAPDRRRELAARISGRLRARLGPVGPAGVSEPDESLLARVAALRR